MSSAPSICNGALSSATGPIPWCKMEYTCLTGFVLRRMVSICLFAIAGIPISAASADERCCTEGDCEEDAFNTLCCVCTATGCDVAHCEGNGHAVRGLAG